MELCCGVGLFRIDDQYWIRILTRTCDADFTGGFRSSLQNQRQKRLEDGRFDACFLTPI
jgi:hypothetical protein